MKKLLAIFIVFFGLMPVSGHTLEPSYDSDLELDDNGYAYKDSCKVTNECSTKDDGCLFVNDGSSCYIADMDGREKHCQKQLVCILEKAENKVTKFSKTSACWWAETSSMQKDVFLYYIGQNLDIKECKDNVLKYNPNNSAGKTKAFIKDNGTKIITDKNGRIAKSLVSNYTITGSIFTSGLAKEAYKTIAQNVCYGYVCTDSNGKYKPMCPDGSCTDGCPNDITVDPDQNPTPSPTDPNVTNRNSAKPYLDAIDNQCP